MVNLRGTILMSLEDEHKCVGIMKLGLCPGFELNKTICSCSCDHVALHTWRLSPGIQMSDECFGFCLALQELVLSLNTVEFPVPIPTGILPCGQFELLLGMGQH